MEEKKDNNDIELQMESVSTSSQEETITGIYNDICSKVFKESLSRFDLYYEMIMPNNNYCWMSVDHPVAQVLKSNEITYQGKPREASFDCVYGYVVVYQKKLVDACVDALVELCHEYNLIIN